MFGTHDFTLFLMAGITLNLLPGPDTLYIIGRSVAQGRQAGFFSVFGISTGSLVHTTAAAFGLSAILATSATAFGMIRWLGAAYLVYLGIQIFFQKGHDPSVAPTGEEAGASLLRIYIQGMMTNLLNPKVALFFMAFLPQFVAPERASSPLPFLFLGGVFIFTGTLWCLFVAAVAATTSKTLRTRSRSLKIARRITGAVFVALGIRLARQQVR